MRRALTSRGRRFRRRAFDSSFTPASLSLTAWWEAPYAASPWVGGTSAGTSGSVNLTEATNPPSAGTALNGFAPALFDGTNDKLGNATSISSFFTAAAGSFIALFKPGALDADGIHNNDTAPKVFSDTASIVALKVTDAGAKLYIFGGPVILTPAVALSVGTWVAVKCKWDGTNVYVGSGTGAFGAATSMATASAFGAGTLRVGCNYNASSFLNAQIAGLVFGSAAWPDDDFNNVVTYWNSKFGLSL
jgi:hypothetical protein